MYTSQQCIVWSLLFLSFFLFFKPGYVFWDLLILLDVCSLELLALHIDVNQCTLLCNIPCVNRTQCIPSPVDGHLVVSRLWKEMFSVLLVNQCKNFSNFSPWGV